MLKKFINPEMVIFLSAFALYSFLAVFAPMDIWNSPDETANAFFIRGLAQGRGLAIGDSEVISSGGLIHPRSVAVRDGLLVPGSFIGMILFYALPVFLFGSAVLPFLTPFFSALALIAFGSILKKYLSLRAARLSVILALFHPALWYYANRGLFHNVFFLDCVIFIFYFASVRPSSVLAQKYGHFGRFAPYLDGVFSGGIFMLALAVRTFEAFWLLPLVLILLWACRHNLPKTMLGAIVGMIIFTGVLFLLISAVIYGSFLPSGYPSINLMPFGFSLRNIVRNGLWYGRLFFWWHTLIAGLGIIYLIYLRIKTKCPTALWRGFLVLLGITFPLFIIYGSGAYLDSPDPRQITIGNSIVRYWLPLYVGFVPFGAWFLDQVARRFKNSAVRMIFFILIVAATGILSFRVVFYGAGEGLTKVISELNRYREVRATVLLATPPKAIIISDRSDKIFFPYRHVAVGTSSGEVIDSLNKFSVIGPLYVYALKMEGNDPRLDLYDKAGFKLNEELQFDKERLYSLRKK